MWKFIMGACTMLSIALTIPRPELPKLPEASFRDLGSVMEAKVLVVDGKPITEITTARGRHFEIKGVIRAAEGDEVVLVHIPGRIFDTTEVEIGGRKHAIARMHR